MPTDDLYSRDAYLPTTDATVTEATDEGLVLDRTVFYPRGGGQPGDTGTSRGPAARSASPTP